MENPKKILDRLGTWPKKKFGQNFLVNLASAKKIYDFASPHPNSPILEIGPGLGAMSEVILQQRHPLLCIEKDRDLTPHLQSTYFEYENFHCIEHDFLTWDMDFSPFFNQPEKPNVISNLPYSITTPIIEKLFEHRSSLGTLSFLLQREFVERICAKAGSKSFGRLSVWLQCYYVVEQGPVISPTSFHPRPTIDSRLVKLTPKPNSLLSEYEIKNENDFFTLIKLLFNQRRKMIRSTLNHHNYDCSKIDPETLKKRPENFSIESFIRLYQQLQ